MINEFLIPQGFKDEVTFDAYVEHEYKSKIIDYFRLNGFDLVKTPLIEFKNNENTNNFLIEVKKNENQLRIRNDITPQIIRLVSSRLKNQKRPLKLCYYGEVVRKHGTMLRPERQFLQVGAETIGEKNVDADIEIIDIAYKSLSLVGVQNITIELSSRIFLEKLFSKLINKSNKYKLEELIRKKELDNCLKLIEPQNKEFIKNIFLCTGNFSKVNSYFDSLCIDTETTAEIKNIRKIVSKLVLNKKDNLYFDFCEIDEKNYHSGIRFTFFAKNVRGEIASGGRYFIKNKNLYETATGFTCFMDTIIRASSFENVSKKILILFDTEDSFKNKLVNEGYVLFSIFERNGYENLKEEAKNYGCSYYLENMKVKSV